MSVFTVSVYAGIPKAGQEPLLSFTIKAESGLDAQHKAAHRADVKAAEDGTYIVAEPQKLTP